MPVFKTQQDLELCFKWFRWFKADKTEVAQKYVFWEMIDSLYYHVVIREKAADRLEELPTEQKLRYWNEAKQLHTGHKQRILLSKALYILDLDIL